jgi:DNA polymerase-3 subunit gamma/tau
VCKACTEIDSGRFVDYIEMDAASNRGVDEMAQLLDKAVYAPTAGRFKVYMIDEVHMLTNHAFNAMLKTLEEPPEHVKFILATTDPQKIPVTVLSRCLQFNLKQMPPGTSSRTSTTSWPRKGSATTVARCACWRRPPTGRCAMRCR